MPGVPWLRVRVGMRRAALCLPPALPPSPGAPAGRHAASLPSKINLFGFINTHCEKRVRTWLQRNERMMEISAAFFPCA